MNTYNRCACYRAWVNRGSVNTADIFALCFNFSPKVGSYRKASDSDRQ